MTENANFPTYYKKRKSLYEGELFVICSMLENTANSMLLG